MFSVKKKEKIVFVFSNNWLLLWSLGDWTGRGWGRGGGGGDEEMYCLWETWTYEKILWSFFFSSSFFFFLSYLLSSLFFVILLGSYSRLCQRRGLLLFLFLFLYPQNHLLTLKYLAPPHSIPSTYPFPLPSPFLPFKIIIPTSPQNPLPFHSPSS